jgi:tetratricopeptide (TPR) repeat protein
MRDEAQTHARAIVDATDLPVSADLEKGFGNTPDEVAETIRRAADAGLVGCTIEDATGDPEKPLYDLAFAVERITAAAEVVRALPLPFRIYGGNREYDEAITYLTRAIRADPDYAHGTGYAQRAYAYKMKGELDAAKPDFAEACKRGTTSVCTEPR